MNWSTYESPVGRLTLIGGELGLRAVHFEGHGPALDPIARDDGALRDALRQMEEYFSGEREVFDVALDLSGTELQLRVWSGLRELPFGGVTTYGDLARELGVPDSEKRTGAGERWVSAAQKVGSAVGATPTPIVIPCHRVVGADGSLTGYRGGLQRKRALLDFEAARAGRAGIWAHQGQLSLL
jgi:methylated-DNA-[protein]-cysteine S-methyltransferase